jgi:hypothetical protein
MSDDTAGRLFDYAVTRPEGFTRGEACAALGVSHYTFKRAAHKLRLILADDDTINLIANRPPLWRDQWLYQLVGNTADAMWWSTNRRKDSETRLRTIHAVNRSMVAGTTARTLDGRAARVIDKGLGRLIEDLDDLNAEV